MSAAYYCDPEPESRCPGDRPGGVAGEAGAARVEELETELSLLRRAMDSREVIDQARGMVMGLGPCTPEAAWEVLVEVSQVTNTKLREVALALVATTTGTELRRPLAQALKKAFARHRNAASGAGG